MPVTLARPLAVAFVTTLTCLSVLSGLSGTGTALAQAAPGGGAPPGQGPPGQGPPVYTSPPVTWNGVISGDFIPGRVSAADVPPQCWLDPRFGQDRSWRPGDPTGVSSSADADTYWWWLAGKEPGLINAINHITDARARINQDFREVQRSGNKNWWWWVPVWLNDSQGFACAQGLVGSSRLNYGLMDFGPPVTGGAARPGHTIDPQILADMARASLRLPTLTVHTSPVGGAGSPAEVNLPVWVWVTYQGVRSPADRAAVPLPGGGTLWARVRTSRPAVTISVSDPAQAHVYSDCGASGSRYTGAAGVPACGVTFLAPSIPGPYTLTVTAHWRVTWSASTGARGGFPSPPNPRSQVRRSVSMTVREIQSVNGGG